MFIIGLLRSEPPPCSHGQLRYLMSLREVSGELKVEVLLVTDFGSFHLYDE